MRVLIDTNIVLDFLLQREPFAQDAELIFKAINTGQIVGYVTATTLTDIFCISRKHTRSVDQAIQAVLETLTAMVICPVNRGVLESAFKSVSVFVFLPPAKFHFVKSYSESISKFQNTVGEKLTTLTKSDLADFDLRQKISV